VAFCLLSALCSQKPANCKTLGVEIELVNQFLLISFGFNVESKRLTAMMEEQQKFCLKWNQFHQNVKEVFNELREGQFLFDVTLACNDGIHVGAHRIILAACSSFFRGLFTENNHSHPWIYLKGIPSVELKAVVDFMYLGEVNVSQDNLSQFLATAEELKVKGLSGYKSMSGMEKKVETLKDHQNYSGVAGIKRHHLVTGTAWENEIGTEMKESNFVENNIKSEYDDDQETEEMEDYNRGLVIVEEEPYVINETRTELNAELLRQIEENLVQSNGTWTCKVCGKVAKFKSKLKQHVETHLDGFSHPCGLCGKSYRSRNVLGMHMSRDHKNNTVI